MISDQSAANLVRPKLSLDLLQSELKQRAIPPFEPEHIGRIIRLLPDQIETHLDTAKLGDICFIEARTGGADKALIVVEQTAQLTRLQALTPLIGVTRHDRIRLTEKYNSVGISDVLMGRTFRGSPLQNWAANGATLFEPLWPHDSPAPGSEIPLEMARFWLGDEQKAVYYGQAHNFYPNSPSDEVYGALLNETAIDLVIGVGVETPLLLDTLVQRADPSLLAARYIGIRAPTTATQLDQLLIGATGAALARGFSKTGLRVLLCFDTDLTRQMQGSGETGDAVFRFQQILMQAGAYELGDVTILYNFDLR